MIYATEEKNEYCLSTYELSVSMGLVWKLIYTS